MRIATERSNGLSQHAARRRCHEHHDLVIGGADAPGDSLANHPEEENSGYVVNFQNHDGQDNLGRGRASTAKLLSTGKRHRYIHHVRWEPFAPVAELQICPLLGQHLSTQRHKFQRAAEIRHW